MKPAENLMRRAINAECKQLGITRKQYRKRARSLGRYSGEFKQGIIKRSVLEEKIREQFGGEE